MSNSNPVVISPGTAAPFTFAVGGNVQAKKGFYVSRKTDGDLLAHCREGNFAYVLAPRQLGKTSLVIRTSQQLFKEGIRSAIVDLSPIGRKTAVEKEWYLSLLGDIADHLDLDVDLDAWWERHSGPGASKALITFFREVLLKQVPQRVVVFLDEIDSTINLPFKDDFFAALRYIYNRRGITPEFERLSFVLIGVATPSDLISEAHRTPFNVGQRVDLRDFTPEEAAPLAAGLGLGAEQSEKVLGWVLKWTNGHPYLTMRLCMLVAESGRAEWAESDVDDLVARAFIGKIENDLNLQFVRDMLTVRVPPEVPLGEVLTTFKELRRRPIRSDNRSRVQTHLKLSGVAREEGSNLVVRNAIYREVFDNKWIGTHRPETWIQTQYQQARRVSALLFAIALVLLALLAFSGYQWNEARKHKKSAENALVLAQSARDVAERSARDAQQYAREATAAKEEAEKRRVEAQLQRERAEEGRRKEEASKALAQQAAEESRKQQQEAVLQRERADAARRDAERQQAAAEEASLEAHVERDKAQEAAEAAVTAKQEAEKSKILADKRSKTDRLYRDAVDLLQSGDREAARTKFKAALVHYQDLGDVQGRAITLRNIANSYVESFMPTGEEALSKYKEAFDAYGELARSADPDDREMGFNGQATTLLLRGDYYREREDKVAARKEFEAAGAIFKDLKDSFGQAQTQAKIAETYYDGSNFTQPSKSDFAAAKSYLEQARDLYQSSGKADEEGRMLAALIRIAERDAAFKDQLPRYYAQRLALYEKAKNRVYVYSTLRDLLFLAHGAGNTGQLNEYYDKFIEYYGQDLLSDSPPVADAENTVLLDGTRPQLDSVIVAVYDSLDESRRRKTTDLFARVLAKYEEKSDYANQGRVQEVQGRIHYYADKDKKVALEKYQEALNIYSSHGLTADAIRTLQYMGQMQYTSGRKDAARQSYERAVQLLPPSQDAAKAQPPESTIMDLMMGLAEMNQSTGRPQEALRYYREALASSSVSLTRPSDNSRLVDLLWSAGALTAKLEGEAAADKFYDEAFATLKKTSSPDFSLYYYPGMINNLTRLSLAAGDRRRTAYFLAAAASHYTAMKPFTLSNVSGLSTVALSYLQVGEKQEAAKLLDKAYAIYNLPRVRTDTYTLPIITSNFKSVGEWERASDMYFKFKLRALFADKEGLPNPSDSDDLNDELR